MKELILYFAMTFAQENNVTLPPIEYRIAILDYHYAITKKMPVHWEITFDEELLPTLSKSRIKTLVYHELGHTIGLKDNDNKRDIMNPKYAINRYQYFKK